MIQSLFFCFLASFAQTDLALDPPAGTFLGENQSFRLSYAGEAPILVRVFLNDAVILELDSAPFNFELALDTALSNRIRVVATFADGRVTELIRTYAPPSTDDAATVNAFQIFPYLDDPYTKQRVTFETDRSKMAPERFESASAFPLELVICLDVSGSMRWELENIRPALLKMFDWLIAQQAKVHVIVFDRNPRLVDAQQLVALQDWETLYEGSAKSAVWDSLATATGFFGDSPRRAMLLISDGMDSGSKHTDKTVTPFIRESGASLLWLNPTDQTPSRLIDLAKDSGGFMVRRSTDKSWGKLLHRMNHQMWLLAPQADYPIDLKVKQRKVWHPRWDD